jgi:type VI secretion system secreted protein VgrG
MQRARHTTVSAPSLKAELLLLSVVGREALSEPFEYKLEFLVNETLDAFPLLGQPMQLSMLLDDGSTREVNGLASNFSMLGEHGRFVRYEARLRPSLWLLANTRNCRIFQGKDVPSVALEILSEHGLTEVQNALTVKYPAREYLVQYRESDLAFVQRILEHEGIYYYFEHHDGKHVLVLADALSAHSEASGYEKVPYYAPLESKMRERDHIDGWFVSRRIVPAGYAANGFNFERAGSKPFTGGRRQAETPVEMGEVFDYPGYLTAQDQADEHARIRLEELQVESETVRGSGDARGLRAGSLFTLSGYPRDDQNKRYLLVETRYELVVDSYESVREAKSEEQCRVEFVAIDATRPYRPPLRTRKPVVDGPQTAVVVGPGDQEIWTDDYGRVKLQFPWDRYGQADQNSSCWVRVAQLWAGSGFGGMHVPRIGQEVIVDFLEGDPDKPIVVGRVYNADNMPPYALPGSRTQSGIKSRSVKNGLPDNANEIRFEDQRGQEELYVQAERDLNAVVKNDQSTSVGVKQTVSVGTMQIVSVGTEQVVSVGTNQTLSVGANRTASVGAADSAMVGGARDVTVMQADTLTTKGHRTATHDAGRTVTVKGSDQETVNAGDKTTTVHGAYAIDADSYAVDSRGSFLLSCPSGSVSAGPPGDKSAGAPASIVSVIATDALVLQCGENSITITKQGISISSPNNVAAFVGDNALDLSKEGSLLAGTRTVVTSDGDTDISGNKVNLLKAAKRKAQSA